MISKINEILTKAFRAPNTSGGVELFIAWDVLLAFQAHADHFFHVTRLAEDFLLVYHPQIL